MNTRAFTILETVLATILATLLIIGTAAVFQNMQSQTTKFKTSVDKDMRWVEANRHLVESVHASSFLNILPDPSRPNQSTLELHNYGGDKKGTYTNDNTGLSYQDATSGAITTFPGVNATFTAPSTGSTTGKGWKNNKLIETIINYSAPFTSTLRLRCAVGTKAAGGTTGAVIIGGSEACDVRDIIQTSDGGYLMLGTYSTTPSAYGPMVLKLTDKLEHEWHIKLHSDGGIRGSWQDFEVKEVFNNAHQSIGYIFSEQYWSLTSGGNMNEICMIDTLGNVKFLVSPSAAIYYTAPIYAAKNNNTVTGYILVGGGPNYYAGGVYHYPILVAKIDTSGNLSGYWLYEFSMPSYTVWSACGLYADQTYDASGNATGFVITGILPSTPMGSQRLAFFTIDASGNVGQSRAIVASGIWNAFHVKQVYNSLGVPDGYVIGCVQKPTSLTSPTPAAVYRLDKNCNYKWSRYVSPYSPRVYQPYRICPTNDGNFVISDGNGLVKMNDAGTTISGWPKSYAVPGRIAEAMTLSETPTHTSGVVDGYIAAGRTLSTYPEYGITGFPSTYIVKTDLNGNCNIPADSSKIPKVYLAPKGLQSAPASITIGGYAPPVKTVTPTLISKNPGDP